MPKRMERQFFPEIGASEQRLRHHRKTATDAGEAANFRKTSELDRAFVPAFDFKNRMRNFWIGNVSFVSGVEQNERIMLTRVINPTGELLARRDRAGRGVGQTKINEIDMCLCRLGNEIVFGRAWQTNDAFGAALFSRRAGVTGHPAAGNI